MIKYIYGDLVFIENIAMNYIILLSTAKLTRSEYKKTKLLLASAVGSIYSVFYYFPGYEYLYTWFLKIIFSLFIIIIAFTPYKLKEFARLIGVFYISSFIFGGAAFGLFYLLNGIKFSYKGVFYLERFPARLLLLSIITAYFIVKYSWDYILYRIRREKVLTKIIICFDNRKTLLTALVDTGNSLNDPISKLPVVVAEYSSVKEILPYEIQRLFEDNKENNLNLIASVMSKSEWLTKFRIIPFKSLGSENAMMIGFKPDEFNIENQNEKQIIKEIIIGIYNKRLSRDGEYSALIHPDILSIYNGGNSNA